MRCAGAHPRVFLWRKSRNTPWMCRQSVAGHSHAHAVSSCPNECVGGLWVCGWKCFLAEIPHRRQQNMQFEVTMQRVIQGRPEWSHLWCLGTPSLQSQYTISAFLVPLTSIINIVQRLNYHGNPLRTIKPLIESSLIGALDIPAAMRS